LADRNGVWLYAVTTPAAELAPIPVPGVAGEPVRTVESSGLVAVVGTVDLDQFGDAELHRKLNELSTLETIARAHHHVADTVARLGPTLPARLATLFGGDSAVAAMMKQRKAGLHAALAHVSGRSEWGLKIYARAQPVVTPEAGSPAGSGTEYLLRRRAVLAAAQQEAAHAIAAAELVNATLSRKCAAVRAGVVDRMPQQQTPLVSRALLVDDRLATEFLATARALKESHPDVRIDVTGPWPAYSFADLEEGADSART
jgi:Gas vesicle synthesis protein GvpL/GvpF